MKKMFFLFGLLFSLPAFADVDLENLLNRVTLQLHAEQWATTDTALVNVTINAALTDQGIETIQASIIQKLKKISDKSEWHIVSFERQQDQSGLENVQMSAEARLPQTELANLRSKAKALTKPGETYAIESVVFTPSDEELRQVKIALRNNIYQQAKTEIDALNKIYPEQKYYLHQIDFIMQEYPMPVAQNMMVRKAPAAAIAPLNIGNKLEQQATVVLAAMPEQVAQKITAQLKQ